jgi:GR25 family glycosyltransferase involved in LPS biosynthesis
MLDDFMRENFKKRYVLNLKHRKDRYAEFRQRASAYFDPDLFEVFYGVYGKELNLESLSEPYLKNPNTRKGEIGCHLSHRQIWKNIAEDDTINDNDLVIVFEDDVFFSDGFEKNFEEAVNSFNEENKHFDVSNKFLYIGGRFDKYFTPSKKELDLFWNRTKNNNRLHKRNHCPAIPRQIIDRTTHVLIFSKYCAKIFLESSLSDETKKPVAVDLFLLWCHGENKGSIEYYDYIPHLCYSPIDYKTDIQ